MIQYFMMFTCLFVLQMYVTNATDSVSDFMDSMCFAGACNDMSELKKIEQMLNQNGIFNFASFLTNSVIIFAKHS